MKTINIKGKEYIEVSERIKHFRENYKNHCLVSEVLEKTDVSIMIKASVIDDKGVVRGTGLAEEEKGSTYINKTSYVENCETSAWGRALANFGIGLDTSVASADEVQNAIANQNKKPAPKKVAPKKTETNGLIALTKSHPKWKTIKGWIGDNKELSFEQVMAQLESRCTKESLYTKAMTTEIDKLVSVNKKQ